MTDKITILDLACISSSASPSPLIPKKMGTNPVNYSVINDRVSRNTADLHDSV
ncbi:hypothetical protein [Apilactobacillus xinyiensis]|uniref:hypothetical protein n=1 Tax=Apilactobacillus xinyiensis TaxID=2841032 RepID=UPI00200C4FAD|nr:hypothetical protein [Apilactobacillus xinyiensis]MCL0329810.1 hypothetical protein [Apilactobacillus xinyiensis]